ncbi:MAG TPA: carboxypeptidase-like regulatory domain-containing protein [Archangium sp.]|nr:carboxypeptidase-like regulatory domain-containing protein [Archangium sp.]
MKKHWAVVLPLLVVGCTSEDKDGDGIADGVREPDSVTVVVPANPQGTVSGQVLNTRMEPLADASVKLTIGSATAEKPFQTTTDTSGNFLLTRVPAGSEVLVTVSKEGHATLRASALVPSHAGNIPINNGNANIGAIALAETKSSVSFSLVTPSGYPARGAKAYVEAVPAGTLAFNGGTASALSSVVVSAEADSLGVVTFPNVPSPAELARIGGVGEAAGGYRLWVDPVDYNGDGIFDAGGYAQKIDASALVVSGGSQMLRLPAPRSDAGGTGTTGFQLVATNVPSLTYVKLADGDANKPAMELQKKPLRNLLRSGEPIYLGFSQPVARESLLALVADEYGREKYDVIVTVSAAGDVYTLMPPSTLREGVEYNLYLRATSAYDGTVRTWRGYFISGDPRTPRPLQLATAVYRDGATGTAGTLDPGECIILSFTHSVLPSSVLLDTIVTTGEASPPSFKATPAAPPSANPCFTAESPTRYPIDSTNFNDTTTRFVFTYSGTPINLTTNTVKVRADFTKFQSADLSMYYETAWGTPVSAGSSLEAPLSRL